MHDPGMQVSVENRLRKQQRALLLGASDMDQAMAAAKALAKTQDAHLARALETAMTVCFMRPFTASDLQVPGKFFPEAGEGEEAFWAVKSVRDKVYAHTDADGGRTAGPITLDWGTEIINLSWQEGWLPFPRDRIERFIVTCEEVRDSMRIGAGAIQRMLDGEMRVEIWK
jgi:hypothetical protein